MPSLYGVYDATAEMPIKPNGERQLTLVNGNSLSQPEHICKEVNRFNV